LPAESVVSDGRSTHPHVSFVALIEIEGNSVRTPSCRKNSGSEIGI
jgi:hypothetical protein